MVQNRHLFENQLIRIIATFIYSGCNLGLFIVGKRQKLLRYSLTGERINKGGISIQWDSTEPLKVRKS